MFTGIIETLGKVERVAARAGMTRLAIRSALPIGRMRDGESVAVDGVCLTVARRAGAVFEADVVPETLARTTLGALAAGHVVHLERALAVGDRLGGHMVQGHVDAVARVVSWGKSRGDVRLEVALPKELAGLVALKGSITLNGVALTVASVTPRSFTVALIPETLEKTLLGRLKPGHVMNVEADLIARYLDALMRHRGRRTSGRTSRARLR